MNSPKFKSLETGVGVGETSGPGRGSLRREPWVGPAGVAGSLEQGGEALGKEAEGAERAPGGAGVGRSEEACPGERAGAARLGLRGPGAGAVDPSGCGSQSRTGGGGGQWSFFAAPRARWLVRAEFSSPRGLSGPRLTHRGPRSGVWTTALRGPRRGAPPLRVPGARAQRDGLPPRSPPSPGALAGTHRARGPALRAGPRSGSAGPAQAPVVAAVGPLYGALWEPRERALGQGRGRCRGISMVPPARLLERPGRCAGGRRAGPAGSGADAHAPPALSASAPGALGLGSRPGRRGDGVAAPAAACVSAAAAPAAPGAARGLLGPGRLPALLPMHG